MLKKIFLLLTLCSLPIFATAAEKINSDKVLQAFSKNLDQIRASLKDGKMSDRQAMILLLAVQARQNQVIIQQNAEIIALLNHDKGKQ